MPRTATTGAEPASPTQITVEPAAPGDGDDIAQLLEQARGGLSGHRGGGRLLESLESVTTDPALILTARRGTAGAGFLLASLERPGAPRGVLSVLALYVAPEHRRLGVGRTLLDAAITWGLARGASGIDVDALPGDRVTKNFLEALGFKARLLVMHRALAP